MISSLNRWHTGLLDLFFPRCCLVCGQEDGWACPTCSAQVVAQSKPLIQEDSCITLLSFEQPLVRELVHNLKYSGISEAAESLVELCLSCLPGNELQELLSPEGLSLVLVPVPTSMARLKKRGYNQARLLAEAFAQRLGCEVWCPLVRKGKQVTQVGKSRAERTQHRENVFQWNLQDDQVDYYRNYQWVIVDDVLTTGSTLQTVTEVLLQKSQYSLRSLICAYAGE